LVETNWEIILDEDECIKMYSNEMKKVTGKIFFQNKVHLDKEILHLEASALGCMVSKRRIRI
jgi:hypothetical protein